VVNPGISRPVVWQGGEHKFTLSRCGCVSVIETRLMEPVITALLQFNRLILV
jgi:hypothetical protein